MNVLFIHQNFPAQFKHLAPALAARGHKVVALANRKADVEGVNVIPYRYLSSQTPGIHPLAQEHEAKVIRGESIALVCRQLIQQGYSADVIYVHPGWGEALFLRDLFPSAKIIAYAEYFYRSKGQDVGFETEFGLLSEVELFRLRMKNTCAFHALDVADAVYSPSQWQRDTYPDYLQDKIHLIHDGMDVAGLQSVNDVSGFPAPLLPLPKGAPYITFVARGLEPLRGFHHFMRVLPALQQHLPDLQAVVIGADETFYGSAPTGAASWRAHFLAEQEGQLDRNRVHFLGSIDYQDYREILRGSQLHFYLSAPFVTSWSVLEALIMGRRVITWDLPTLDEFQCSALHRVEPRNLDDLAEKALGLLRAPAEVTNLPADICERLEVGHCLQAQLNLLRELDIEA